jgi:hypothetical protein
VTTLDKGHFLERPRWQDGSGAAKARSFVSAGGADPFAWLKNVLTRIAAYPINRLTELLPHNWVPSHA